MDGHFLGKCATLSVMCLSLAVTIPAADTKAADTKKAARKAQTTAAAAAVTPGYRIGAGDVLQIVVWKEPDVSVPSVVVRPDGKISVPLVKEVDVLGMTTSEVEAVLSAKLSQFIHGADVTVVPKEIHSKRVYLVGALKKEGPVDLWSPMTVLQAITEAGGLTDYAKSKKIYILRRQNGQEVKLPFNYEQVLKGERMEQNIFMLPEDVLVVPH
jgi:polysaccharide export outer membrane protein